jgi:hypothetical protein
MEHRWVCQLCTNRQKQKVQAQRIFKKTRAMQVPELQLLLLHLLVP